MSKNLLDDFNEEKPVEATSKPISKAWKDEPDKGYSAEAVCVVCDVLFTPTANRPPILCPACKEGLHEILQRETGL